VKWYRFYNETRHDPKVQRLPAELFRTWVNLLCLASENGGTIPGTPEDLAYELRMSVSKALRCIEELKAAGLLDSDPNLHPHNWGKRQYQSDNVATRVKRYRERHSNGECNVTETPPDTDSEQIQSRTEVEALARPTEEPANGKSKRGTRLSPDWRPCEANYKLGAELGFSGPEVDAEVPEFKDYWIPLPGNRALKLDWDATFNNRLRDIAKRRKRETGGIGRMVHRQKPNSLIAAASAVLAQIEGEQ
jgi:hypothetical protein